MRQWQPWPSRGGPCHTPPPRFVSNQTAAGAARLPVPQRRTLACAPRRGRVCCHMLSACSCTLQAQHRLPRTPPRCGSSGGTIYAVKGQASGARQASGCGPRTVLNGTTQPRCVHTAARGAAPPLSARARSTGERSRGAPAPYEERDPLTHASCGVSDVRSRPTPPGCNQTMHSKHYGRLHALAPRARVRVAHPSISSVHSKGVTTGSVHTSVRATSAAH